MTFARLPRLGRLGPAGVLCYPPGGLGHRALWQPSAAYQEDHTLEFPQGFPRASVPSKGTLSKIIISWHAHTIFETHGIGDTSQFFSKNNADRMPNSSRSGPTGLLCYRITWATGLRCGLSRRTGETLLWSSLSCHARIDCVTKRL